MSVVSLPRGIKIVRLLASSSLYGIIFAKQMEGLPEKSPQNRLLDYRSYETRPYSSKM